MIALLVAVAFQRIVIVVQENRTPDNLFYTLCDTQTCSDNGSVGYDIKVSNWLNKGGATQPLPVDLANQYDLDHSHSSFNKMCDLSAGGCLMDGAANESCSGTCLSQPQFRYVDNSTATVQPYLDMATQYGWANKMFQTNQGPSFPAHQFLFGATSSVTTGKDAKGVFAAENYFPPAAAGCAAPIGTVVQLIGPDGRERNGAQVIPCFERQTISDLMDGAGVSWRYYAPDFGMWTAPAAISHICGGVSYHCEGTIWNADVDLTSADVLTDIQNCNLRSVSWVVPSGPNSDHAGTNDGGGPSWVASIVNAVGQSQCGYWQNTAIIVTWDDWGGWYDHEAPQFLAYPEGGYQMGFRVPLLFISAYTPPMIDNAPSDFGSIARFAEQNFGIAEGALGFADARSGSDLTEFVTLRKARAFVPIKASKDASFFLHDKRPQTAPDND